MHFWHGQKLRRRVPGTSPTRNVPSWRPSRSCLAFPFLSARSGQLRVRPSSFASSPSHSSKPKSLVGPVASRRLLDADLSRQKECAHSFRPSWLLLATYLPRYSEPIDEHTKARRPEGLLRCHQHGAFLREGLEHTLRFPDLVGCQ